MHNGNRTLKSAVWCPARLCMRAREARSPQSWTRALMGSRGASIGVGPPINPGAGRSPGRLEPCSWVQPQYTTIPFFCKGIF